MENTKEGNKEERTIVIGMIRKKRKEVGKEGKLKLLLLLLLLLIPTAIGLMPGGSVT
jgi:hypothetical protein